MIAHDLKEISPQTWSNGHLEFRPAKPNAWDILLGPQPVAHIRWNSVWKEYVLLTRNQYIFAEDCLEDIAKLLRYLNATKP